MNTTVDFRPLSSDRWIALADRHWSAANRLTSSAPGQAAFWYHQAAERYLKDCLVRRGEAFANSVTDLRTLLKTCAALEPRYEGIASLDVLERMSRWETAFAYPPAQPEEPDPAVPDQAALGAARDVCERLRELALKDNSEGGRNDGPG